MATTEAAPTADQLRHVGELDEDRDAIKEETTKLPGITVPDLDGIPDGLRPRALEALEEGDVDRFLGYADNVDGLEVVCRNVMFLDSRRLFERGLVKAYASTRTNWAAWPLYEFDFMLENTDPDALRAAGDALPPGDSFELYRGAAGVDPFRKPEGMSWTSSLETAAWFALRPFDGSLEDPAIYRATVPREAVLWYDNSRDEHDFVTEVRRPRRLHLSPERIEELADAHEERLRQRYPFRF